MAVAVDPSSRFTFVADVNGDVSTFTIDSTTGALQFVGSLVTNALNAARAVDPAGKFLYVLNEASGEISGFAINQTNGTLQLEVFATATGTDTRGIAIDPTGRFIYAAVLGGPPGSGMIRSYSINSTTGALTMTIVTAKPTAGTPLAITADPSEKYVYVSTELANGTEAYAINQVTGDLSLVGVPAIAGQDARSIAIPPRGLRTYTGGRLGGDVTECEIQPATGSLNFQADWGVFSDVVALASDPNGRFLYVLESAEFVFIPVGSADSIQTFLEVDIRRNLSDCDGYRVLAEEVPKFCHTFNGVADGPSAQGDAALGDRSKGIRRDAAQSSLAVSGKNERTSDKRLRRLGWKLVRLASRPTPE